MWYHLFTTMIHYLLCEIYVLYVKLCHLKLYGNTSSWARGRVVGPEDGRPTSAGGHRRSSLIIAYQVFSILDI